MSEATPRAGLAVTPLLPSEPPQFVPRMMCLAEIFTRRASLTRGNISATALHDFVDITVFLILGAVLAALVKLYISPQQIQQISTGEPFLAIPAMMLMAVLMCLCSEADAFVAASFVELHISAKIAFLVLGPMIDLKLLLMYTRVFRWKLIVSIVSCVVLQVFVYSVIVHQLYDPKPTFSAKRAAPPAGK